MAAQLARATERQLPHWAGTRNGPAGFDAIMAARTILFKHLTENPYEKTLPLGQSGGPQSSRGSDSSMLTLTIAPTLLLRVAMQLVLKGAGKGRHATFGRSNERHF
jgi:hypothetical protein